MAQTNYANLSPELQAMVLDHVFDNHVQRPCSNNLCCLTNYTIRRRPNSTTTTVLSVNRQMHSGLISYQFSTFDIFLIHGRVTVCLGYNTRRLYLQSLPLVPSMRGTFLRLTELWIVDGLFPFAKLNTITPLLTNLQRINLEHDMTYESVFYQPPVFVVDYCNNSSVYHYPPTTAQLKLVLESKFMLEYRNNLLGAGDSPIEERDLRWFLTRPEKRPKSGVRITVHLRCPMRLCDACAMGGNSSLFRVFEKKMVSLLYLVS